MGQERGDPTFVDEVGDEVGVAREVGQDAFHHREALDSRGSEIVGEKHFSHTADRDSFHQAVPPELLVTRFTKTPSYIVAKAV